MNNFENIVIVWTDYIKYSIKLRKYDILKIENILKYTSERYFDTVTQRKAAIGRHHEQLVIVPYEIKENTLIPITIHAITRKQINFRLKTGRFVYE